MNPCNTHSQQNNSQELKENNDGPFNILLALDRKAQLYLPPGSSPVGEQGGMPVLDLSKQTSDVLVPTLFRPKFTACFSLSPRPYCLTVQPHDAGETLSAGTRDCSQLRVPGKTISMRACTQTLIKYSLLLLRSARWKHSAQGEVRATAVVLSQ